MKNPLIPSVWTVKIVFSIQSRTGTESVWQFKITPGSPQRLRTSNWNKMFWTDWNRASCRCTVSYRHQTSCETSSLRTHAFLQDIDNIGKPKLWDIVYTEKCASRLSQRQHSECVTVCLPAYSGSTDLRGRREWAVQRGREQKEGKWKMQVVCACACGSAHLKYINITWSTPELWDKGHFMWGKKRKHIGLRNVVFSVCCRFAFMSEGRQVLVMYCGFFTCAWLLANDYFIYVAFTFPVPASLSFSFLSLAGKNSSN